jgi:hypothetical protein
MQLHDREGRLMDEWRGPPIPSYATDEWREGEILRGQYEMRIPADAQIGHCQLRAWLGQETKGASSRPSQEAVWVETVEVKARQRVFEAPLPVEYPEEYVLGGQVRLLGYSVEKTDVAAGESVRVTLYWQTGRRMETSWKVFTHLLDGTSQIWGQRDSIPVEGTYPTTGWLEGEVVTDRYELPIRPDAPAGRYQLEVGMYDPQTGERLGVVDAMNTVQEDDRALLGVAIEVVGIPPQE